MKKHVKITAVLMALALMFSLCSCTDKGSKKSSGDSGRIVSDDDDKGATEKTTEDTTEGTSEATTTQNGASFSNSTLGSICQLTSDAIGTDLTTAEKMFNEFFGIELVDGTGNILTDERGGIATTVHVYVHMLVKDDVRFNGMQIWTDKEDGHVRRIELVLCNTSYTTVAIEETPEFMEEIKTLNKNINDELKKSLGDPYESGDLVWDEDSLYSVYKVSDGCLAYVEIRDFTEEGGNGLLKTQLIFADCKELAFD